MLRRIIGCFLRGAGPTTIIILRQNDVAFVVEAGSLTSQGGEVALFAMARGTLMTRPWNIGGRTGWGTYSFLAVLLSSSVFAKTPDFVR
ncbi:MAG: hypothetical protein RTU92_01050 [Candidatus Thorarchaeota archaeon]